MSSPETVYEEQEIFSPDSRLIPMSVNFTNEGEIEVFYKDVLAVPYINYVFIKRRYGNGNVKWFQRFHY